MTPRQTRSLHKSRAILKTQLALTPFVAEPTETDRLYAILERLFEAGSRHPKPPRGTLQVAS
jgi:hypothetical protein